MAIETAYKGYGIEVRSYRSDQNRWRPDTRLVIYTSGSVEHRQVVPGRSALFETEEQSDQAGVDAARWWIDNRM